MNQITENHKGKIQLCQRRLKSLRRCKGFSQEAMADECQRRRLRVSISSVKRAESGKQVNFRTAREIAKFYEVEITSLINEDQNKVTDDIKITKDVPDPKRDNIEIEDINEHTILYLVLSCSSYKTHSKNPITLCEEISRQYGATVEQRLSSSLLLIFPHSKLNSSIGQSLQAAIEIKHQIKMYAHDDISYRGYLHTLERSVCDTSFSKIDIRPHEWNKILKSTSDLDNQIFVSNDIQRAAENQFHFLKSIDHKVSSSHWILGERKATTDSPYIPLKGRKAQIQQFLALMRHSIESRSAHILVIKGEAGIGKTRTLLEIDQIARQQGIQCYRYDVDKIAGASPHDLCHEISRQYRITHRCPAVAGFNSSESPYHKLVKHVSRPSPQIELGNTRQIISEFLNWQDTPTMITIDDVHWSSNDAFENLMALIEPLKALPLLIVFGTRKEYGPLKENTLLSQSSIDQTLIELLPLSSDHCREIASTFSQVSEQYREYCIRQSEGVPLFLVQLLTSGNSESTPASLNQAVIEKLSRLDTMNRYAVKIAAVIGGKFSLSTLRKIIGDQHYQPQSLVDLQLVRASDDHISFCHELVRKCIYEQLDEGIREKLHNRVGAVIEGDLESTYDRNVIQVCHHFAMGKHSKKRAKYHFYAGRVFFLSDEYQSALAHLTNASSLIDQWSASKQDLDITIEIQLSLAAVYKMTLGWVSHPVQQAYRRAEELSRRAGDPCKLAAALLGLWVIKLMTLELSKAKQLAQECLTIGEQLNNDDVRLQASTALSNTYYWQGHPNQCINLGQQAIALYDHRRTDSYIEHYGHDPLPLCITFTSLALSMVGSQQKAQQLRDDLMLSTSIKMHPYSHAIALQASAWLEFHLGRPEPCYQQSKQLLELSEREGFPFYHGVALMFLGWSSTQLTEAEDNLDAIEKGFHHWICHSGDQIAHSLYCLLLALSLRKLSRLQEAIIVIERGVQVCRNHGENCYLAELLHLQASILTQLSPCHPNIGRLLQESQSLALNTGTVLLFPDSSLI